MKKYFSLFLVLLQLILLAGCAGSKAGNALYADLPTVPQTNEHLSVYCIGEPAGANLLSAALNQYQKLYPNVEVELIKPFSGADQLNSTIQTEQYDQLLTQLMAGKGPDVLLLDDCYMDLEKMVRQGIFADMEPFFKADGFDWEPYNQTVMDAGVWNGKRFVIPLSYSFDLLCTTQEALEETGFDVEACKDFQGFLDETTRYLENPARSRRLFNDAFNPGMDFFYKSGISVLDYDELSADLSDPLLTSALQWYRTVKDTHPQAGPGGLLSGASAVRDGQALWTTSSGGAVLGLFYTSGALRTVGEAVMMPIRDVNGGIQAHIGKTMAVRGNSENLKNAYDFLKILLSPEMQCAMRSDFPVLYAAAENYLTENPPMLLIKEGTDGFVSTTHPGSAVDDPSQEEIQQVLALTHEVTGAYYDYFYSNVMTLMGSYIHGFQNFEDALKDAQWQMKLYLTE